ncbi:MAG: Aspartate aminotransferase [Deltaproteobacteria bacterium ADurb.Bin510]|jgi:aspartate aminotransferase|nr:MAG: Aspartate aminotransferase [Deltaproteobacteria bacterium ADurb.Bin510]
MKISKLVSGIPGSATLSLTARVKELTAQGRDIIGFGAGEPDFDTPEHIKQAAIEALSAGRTKYTPAGGTSELKRAVAETINREYGLNYSTQNVIVSCGAKHSLHNLFLALFEAGDEVICPSPYWVSYPPQIQITGARAVFVDTTATGLKMTPAALKAAITPNTRGLILNSPSNPTGMVYTRAELEAIAEICLESDLVIVADDIYAKLVYDDAEFVGIASLSPEVARRTFIIQGVSKAYAMTGWRIGYCIGDAEVIKAMDRFQSHTTSNPTSFAQDAALATLKGPQQVVEDMRLAYQRRRDLMVDKIRDIPGFDIIAPQGAFYCFPSVKGTLERFGNASKLAEYLLEVANVGVVPGVDFGCNEYIRLSFANSEANIVEGLDRIRKALS